MHLQRELEARTRPPQVGALPGLEACHLSPGCSVGQCKTPINMPATQSADGLGRDAVGGQEGRPPPAGAKEVSWIPQPSSGSGGGARPPMVGEATPPGPGVEVRSPGEGGLRLELGMGPGLVAAEARRKGGLGS